MEILITALLILGGLLALVGGIWFLVESFRKSIWWGLGCLLISPVQLVFLIVHWRVAKKPFAVQMLGLVIIFGCVFLADSGDVALD
jgi:hypothetical protein